MRRQCDDGGIKVLLNKRKFLGRTQKPPQTGAVGEAKEQVPLGERLEEAQVGCVELCQCSLFSADFRGHWKIPAAVTISPLSVQ